MAAVLSRNLDDINKLSFYMDECKAMGLTVKGPDINESDETFSVSSTGDIRFGLSAIKGIGSDVVRKILEARGKEPFKDIYDFVERVPAQAINRRVFDSLALAGAFDCFPDIKREDLVAEAGKRGETTGEILLRYGAQHRHEKEMQTSSLFGFDDEELKASSRPQIISAPAWAPMALLEKERQLVGMYLSAHPLDNYRVAVEYGVDLTAAEKNEVSSASGTPVTFAGMVMETTDRSYGAGQSLTVVKVEDFSGTTDFALFDRQKTDFGHLCTLGTPVLVTGRFKPDRRGGVRFNMERVEPLDKVSERLFSSIMLKVQPHQLSTFGELIDTYTSGTAEKNAPVVDLRVEVYEPEIGRHVRFDTAVKLPVTTHLLKALEAAELDFKLERSSISA